MWHIIKNVYPKRCLCFVSCVFVLMGFESVLAKTYDHVNINNPFLNKTPIAVTEFKTIKGSAQESADAEFAHSLLQDTLAFTGYLKVLPLNSFLSNPAITGIQLGQIQFKNWTGIGAELLITGGIELNANEVKLKLRLFDTFKSKLLVGRSYTGPRSSVRKMIRYFCSEVSHVLTGNWGVFNSKLTFVSTVGGNKEIFVSDFDGYNPKQITRHKNISLSPAWSHDGQWIAYVSYAKGKPDIYVKNLKGKRGAIVNYKGTNISPTWMPNQLKFAAALSFSGNQEIYMLTRKGEIIKKITRSWGINVSPRFSPDGKKIAFTSNRAGTPQIYVKDLESNEVHRVTYHGKYNTSPSWSPDGESIAYVGIEKNRINIYVIRLDSPSDLPMQLTMDQMDNEDPSWSPDGSLIVFTSNRKGGVSKLFVMTAAGTDQRQLVELNGKQTQPNWSGPISLEN